MSLTATEMLSLQKACDKLGNGPNYRCNSYISNLMISALDFQMNVKTADNARHHFKAKYPVKTLPELKLILDKYSNTKEDNLKLANDIWNNNHWSRAEFLKKLIDCFDDREVKDQASLEKWVKSADFEADVKGQFKTDRHSIGYALFKWLQIRCGVDTVKPDVHILNFISDAIGRKVAPEVAVDSLIKVAKKTKREAYLLDAAIWNFQKKR